VTCLTIPLQVTRPRLRFRADVKSLGLGRAPERGCSGNLSLYASLSGRNAGITSEANRSMLFIVSSWGRLLKRFVHTGHWSPFRAMSQNRYS